MARTRTRRTIATKEPEGVVPYFTRNEHLWLSALSDMLEMQRGQAKIPEGDDGGGGEETHLRDTALRIAHIAEMGERNDKDEGRKNAKRIALLFTNRAYTPASVELLTACLQTLATRDDGPRLSEWLDVIEKQPNSVATYGLIMELGKRASAQRADMTEAYERAMKPRDGETAAECVGRLNAVQIIKRIFTPGLPELQSFAFLRYDELKAVREMQMNVTVFETSAPNCFIGLRTIGNRIAMRTEAPLHR